MPDSINFLGRINDNIKLHMSQKLFDKLAIPDYYNVEIISIDSLLEKMIFKELNDKILNKEIVI